MSKSVISINDTLVFDLDRSLEIAGCIRAGEFGYARDYRKGAAFGPEGDMRRLDAYMLGLMDALAHRLGEQQEILRLLVYLHKLLEHGPGKDVRRVFRSMLSYRKAPDLTRYIAGGRYHAIKMLGGATPKTGGFAQLLTEELEDDAGAAAGQPPP